MMRTIIAIMLLLGSALTARAQQVATLRDTLSLKIRQIEAYPDSLPLRFEKASINMRLEQWRYAQEEYTAILKRWPDNPEALYFRAFAYDKQGFYDFAAADYEKLSILMPGQLNVMLGLALVRDKQGRVTESMQLMNQIVELFPDSTVAYLARGSMELDRGQNETAEYDFAIAVRLSPNDTDARLLHAESLIRLGRRSEALDELRELCRQGIPAASLTEYFRRCRK